MAYALKVKSPCSGVFNLLAEVPSRAGVFPKLAGLVDMGCGACRWEMGKVGAAQH